MSSFLLVLEQQLGAPRAEHLALDERGALTERDPRALLHRPTTGLALDRRLLLTGGEHLPRLGRIATVRAQPALERVDPAAVGAAVVAGVRLVVLVGRGRP